MRRALALIVLAALAAGAAYYILSFPQVPPAEVDISASFRLPYMVRAYGFEEIGEGIGAAPGSARVEGVPAISYGKQYCATTCLQMIALYYGQNLSIGYLNLITGFTYGASLYRIGDNVYFIPYSDPFAGLKNASAYLGLRYRFLVTSDGAAFTEAIKHFIAEGVPVMVPVNAARLYDLKGFIPHFELVVGYEGDRFIVHEPVTPSPNAPKVVEFGAETLAKANEDMMRAFGMLWRHGMAVYEKGGERSLGASDALRNAGSLLKGFMFEGVNYTVATGSYAVRELADAVEDGLVDRDYLLTVLDMARVNRADDAEYLLSAFPSSAKVSYATKMLLNASRIYGEVAEVVEGGGDWGAEAASLLRSAAEMEYLAGEALIDASYSGLAG